MPDEKNTENIFAELPDSEDKLRLSELKGILRDADTADFSLEDILKEYNIASSGMAQNEEPEEEFVPVMVKTEPFGEDEPDGDEPEEVRVYKPAEKLSSPVFDEPEIHIDEKYFGPPEVFNEAFVPSDKFIGDEDEDTFMEGERESEPGKKNKPFRAAPRQRTDITSAQAGAALQKYVRFLGIRAFCVFLLCIPLIYITSAHRTGWPVPGFLVYLDSPHIFLLFSGMLLLAVMALSIDVVTSGLRDLFTLRPGIESLAAFSCAISALHNLSILIFPSWGGYLPYTAISAVSLFFAMWGSYLKLSAMRWTYKNAAHSRPLMIAKEEAAWQGSSGFVKFPAEDSGVFVEQSEAPDAMERFSIFFSPLMIIAAFVFAFISTVTNGNPSLFLWAFSAIIAPAAAFPAMLSFALPYFLAAKRLSLTGASLAGWTAARVLSEDAVVVITDSDLFPPSTISLNGIKVLGDFQAERVISYAASLISASGSGLSRIFSELLKGQSGAIVRVDNFQHYESGGLGGEISGSRVLVGTSNFLLRMGIRVAREYNIKTGVLVSINHELAGIIALNYVAADSVCDGVDLIVHNHITPVLATRDFNITPLLLKDKFGDFVDMAEFPTIEDRISLSEQSEGRYGKPVAAISREGLLPFAETITSARKLKASVRRNIIITVLSSVVGVMLMFFLCFNGSYSAASPVNLLIYMSVWILPALFLSLFSGKS